MNGQAQRALQSTDKELILGGQKSGKTRRAESLALAWLQADGRNQACYVATGQAWDAEMQQRIARHQNDRRARVPGMRTLEAPLQLAQVLQAHSQPDTLLVVDCLTMWLTNWMMPMSTDCENESNRSLELDWCAQRAHFIEVLAQCPGPVVLVGNEIGLGVIPLGREVRAFVDALGVLNQDVARVCNRATLMAAGLPLCLK